MNRLTNNLRFLLLIAGVALALIGLRNVAQASISTGQTQLAESTNFQFSGALQSVEAQRTNGTISFEVSKNAQGAPTLIDYEFTISHLTLTDDGPQCAAAGSTQYEGQTNNILPWNGGQDGYTFTGDHRPGGIFPKQVSITGLLGRTIDGQPQTNPDYTEGVINAFYDVDVGDEQIITFRCHWTWKSGGGDSELAFAQPEILVGEDAGDVKVEVVRRGNLAGQVTVKYASSDGTATAGEDYAETSGELVFADGQSRAEFFVPVLPDPDNLIEGLEELSLTLSNPSQGAVIAGPNPIPFRIDDRPELQLLTFDMGDAVLEQQGNNFILKGIKFKVKSLSGYPFATTATNVPVVVRSDGQTIYETTIPSIAPNQTIEITMDDWDITDRLIAGAGEALINIIATVDLPNVIPEHDDTSNNSWPAGKSYNVRPILEEITPQYILQSKFFLRGISVSNKIEARVSDWNGDAKGPGLPPYGQVTFDLNQQQTIKNGTLNGAEHTYDMGADFTDVRCHQNVLDVWATGVHPSFESLHISQTTTAVNAPHWYGWVLANLEQYDITFKPKPAGALIDYQYDFTFPSPVMDLLFSVPDWVPVLGGEEFGIQPTSAEIKTKTLSSGSGEVDVKGQSGLAAGIATFTMEVTGSGDSEFLCRGGTSDLEFNSATFGFMLRHQKAKKKLSLSKIVPGITERVSSIPWVGSTLSNLVDSIEMQVSLTPGGGLQATFKDQGGGELEFDNGGGTASVGISGSGSFQPMSNTSLTLGVGGEPFASVLVPSPPGYLEEIGVNLTALVNLRIFGFGFNWNRTGTCSFPDGCDIDGLVSAATQGWTLLPAPAGGADYARFVANNGVRSRGDSQTLLANTSPYPDPSLGISSSGERFLAYSHMVAGAPAGRESEIRVLQWNNGSWQAPQSLTDDQQPDFNPKIATDASGKSVVVWIRSKLSPGTTPEFDTDFLQSLDIAYSVWDGSKWSDPALLTDNVGMERSPSIDAAQNVWIGLYSSGSGESFAGTASDPLSIQYTLYDGTKWSDPAPAVTGLVDLIHMSGAIRSANEAALVFTRASSTRANSTDLYYSSFDGTNWSAPALITSLDGPGSQPQLIYDGGGNRHLLWQDLSGLFWLKNSWNPADAVSPLTPEQREEVLFPQLVAGDGDRAALLWQSNLDGDAGTAYSIYDGTSNTWSAPLQTDGNGIDSQHSAVLDGDGKLHMAFTSSHTELMTHTITLSNAQKVDIPNVPEVVQTDLVYATFTPAADLLVDEIHVQPENPTPGESTSVSAVIVNEGSLPAVSPVLAFYDGDTLISRVTVPTLNGGDRHTETVQFNLGSAPSPHTLRVVADPDGVIEESNEGNNESKMSVALPDLTLAILALTQSTDGIQVTLEVSNTGATSTGPFDLVTRSGTGGEIGRERFTAIEPLKKELRSFSYPSSAFSNPDEEVEFVWIVDAENAVVEQDENNNVVSESGRFLSDLTVQVEDARARSNAFEIVVSNRGSRPTGTTTLLVGSGGGIPTETTKDYSQTLPSIVPGGFETVSVPGLVDGQLYTILVDGENRVAEVNEDNNLHIVRFRAGDPSVWLPYVGR